ncbi:MAG: single-stranded DNA-binding protein [bacterium]|nr:single-stranded DNA-binding protein [bacterium]
MLNKVILIGRLTRDPELKFTANTGAAVATFTLAVNRFSAPGKQEVDFIDIVVWQKQAENCAQYLRKGSLAAVSGRLQIRSYEAKDGSKRKVAEVVADSVQFLSGSGSGPKSEADNSPTTDFPDSGFEDEDVPF